MEKDFEYQIVESIWFDKIGIVKIANEYQTKWYIGIGKGLDQKADEKYIAQWGSPFNINALSYFFNSPTI